MTSTQPTRRGPTLAGLTVGFGLATLLSTQAQMPQAVLDQDRNLATLAVEAAAKGPIAAIPLNGDSGRTFGVVYEHYLIGGIIASQAIAAGRPAQVDDILRHPAWQSRGTVVVAYPIDCDGRPNRPLAIRWQLGGAAPVSPSVIAGPMRGAEASALLPGVGLPDDALVVSLRNAVVSVGATVAIDYAGAVCRGGATTESLRITVTPSVTMARGINGIRLPDGQSSLPSPTTVRIRVTQDAAGRPRFPELIQGPAELLPTAMARLEAETFPPTTINGVPMPLTYGVPFVFTATGEPGQASPLVTQTSPGTRTMTTSSVVSVPAQGVPPPPVPPAPPGQTNQQLARLAMEVARTHEPVPIPLDAAVPVIHGVVFDPFLMAQVKARAAQQAGTPMDSTTASQDLLQPALNVIAFPLTCGDHSVTPTDIQMNRGGATPGAVPAIGSTLSGDALSSRLPGVSLPAGAIGRTFANYALSAGLEVRITYSSAPCGQNETTLALPLQWVRGTMLAHTSVAKLPSDSTVPSPTTVQLRGLVDLEGVYRFPTIADGPADLATTAGVTASQWRFQPYRVNGVAVPTVVITTLTFTTSGIPEPIATPAASGTSPAGTSAPPILTSSTIGGRSTMDFTTPDAAGLSPAKSQCEIAADSTYGLSAAGAIGTGGGPMQGPVRERQYLLVLRGRAGQGLHIVRKGSAMGPDRDTILDVFEITYSGLAVPVTIYLDEYHDGALKAPHGLICASPAIVK